MTKNEFNLLYTIKKYGLQSHRKLNEIIGLSVGYLSQTLREFTKKGWISDAGITKEGIGVLKPYKVDNAIIMAAGMSTRFVPLSLEKPKGLLVVKNEVLIERQIKQLQQAGIKNIVIVLGYKKEAFFYLENKFSNLKFIINSEYSSKNNTNTLYLAQKYLKNSYICSSDNYFASNPFEEFVYQSYYAAVHVTEKTNEWYMKPDIKGNIAKVVKSGTQGDIMLGHVYWNKAFSKAMIKLLNDNHESGNYDSELWEQLLSDNLKILPPMEIKVYPSGTIFEFDSIDELRSFDSNYVNHTQSKIIHNISKVLNCSESEILNFKTINKGLTNTSFVFEYKKTKYVYRHPGNTPESNFRRKHEKKALELAKTINIDPTYIYMDDIEGYKISYYVEKYKTPSYDNDDDSKKVLSVLKQIHQLKLRDSYVFNPWDEACKLEAILRSTGAGIADQEFDQLKTDVEKCYRNCNGDGVEICFCHCDTYAQNWILTADDKTMLIDWEYASNADPGNDIGCYIMDSMWDISKSIDFIKEYCGNEYNDKLKYHFLSYVAIVSYYWYLWALHNEAGGTIMGTSLYNWSVMAKRYSKYCVKNLGL